METHIPFATAALIMSLVFLAAAWISSTSTPRGDWIVVSENFGEVRYLSFDDQLAVWTDDPNLAEWYSTEDFAAHDAFLYGGEVRASRVAL